MEQGSVTRWIQQMRAGDSIVVNALAERYFKKLGDAARRRLHKVPQNMHDAEDVANFVLESVVRNIAQGRYPDLQDRDDLWFLMLAITQRRISSILKRDRRRKAQPPSQTSLTELLEMYDGELADLALEGNPEHVAIEIGDCWQELMRILPNDEFREIARLKLEFYSNREISSMLKLTSRYIDRKVGEIQRLWGQIYHD
jgi:DNA-directed RNA polymerase specialized sigma24 family protein